MRGERVSRKGNLLPACPSQECQRRADFHHRKVRARVHYVRSRELVPVRKVDPRRGFSVGLHDGTVLAHFRRAWGSTRRLFTETLVRILRGKLVRLLTARYAPQVFFIGYIAVLALAYYLMGRAARNIVCDLWSGFVVAPQGWTKPPLRLWFSSGSGIHLPGWIRGLFPYNLTLQRSIALRVVVWLYRFL